MVRGLNFAPLGNTFVYPNTTHGDRVFYLQKVVRLSGPRPGVEAGRVVGVEGSMLAVRVADAVIGVTELLDSDKQPIAADELSRRRGIKAGDRLG